MYQVYRSGVIKPLYSRVASYPGLNTRDKENDTPLNKAALGGHANVAKCLIEEFSCSQYVKGFEGRTILHQLCGAGLPMFFNVHEKNRFFSCTLKNMGRPGYEANSRV